VPKQFLDLGGRTVIDRAISVLADHPGIDGVAVVVPPEVVGSEVGAELRARPKISRVVAGGPTRAESVRNGLRASVGTHVLVHDAARPLTAAATVQAVLDATLRHGAAVPVIPVTDTLRREDGTGFSAGSVERGPVRLTQTPQGARLDWLEEALDAAEASGEDVTDEAQALEKCGRKVALVAGDPANIKITTADDLEQARRRVSGDGMLRVGNGFDVHRFGDRPPLALGGVLFEDEPGLIGHSDADVVLHAAMDAVLGAAGLGDIGKHFPPNDARFAGAASTLLARTVAEMVTTAGFEIVNLDLTLLAERPRVAGRSEEIRGAIGSCFRVPADRVSLKATTLEGLGALGRGEGAACLASALIRVSR
jgi:2-C-methyl-D-erythritol 4-phosphate cytidylyltransferase/2-C-methyl-D-erythritol 2,4-cyclodiphosphate synthase